MTACSRKTGAKDGRDDLKTKAPHGLTQKSGWRTLNSCERRRQDGRSLDKRRAGRCTESERMVLRPERNEARTSCPSVPTRPPQCLLSKHARRSAILPMALCADTVHWVSPSTLSLRPPRIRAGCSPCRCRPHSSPRPLPCQHRRRDCARQQVAGRWRTACTRASSPPRLVCRKGR